MNTYWFPYNVFIHHFKARVCVHTHFSHRKIHLREYILIGSQGSSHCPMNTITDTEKPKIMKLNLGH